jgi:hypothetical protein
LSLFRFFPTSCSIISSGSKYFPQHSVLIYRQSIFLPQYQNRSFTTIHNESKIIVLSILIFKFLDSRCIQGSRLWYRPLFGGGKN